MSCDYYFKQWKETLRHLESLVQLDLEYQKTKAKDKKLCDAVIRLCGMLGEYIVIYNEALDCLQHNLQVQKTPYLLEIVRAVVNRILELKHELRKLECTNVQFLNHGLANHKLTTHNAELDDVLVHMERPDSVKITISEAFENAEKKRQLLWTAAETIQQGSVRNWWDEDVLEEEELGEKDDKEPEREDMIHTRQMASLIQAHERSRQVIHQLTHNKQKRELWEKDLKGTLNPPARLEIRERAAKIIQTVCRAYFQIKRRKKIQCKQDELLGLRLCGKTNDTYMNKTIELNQLNSEKRKEFHKQWHESREKLKQDFINRRGDDLAEDYRDFIREWLRKWFDDIRYFYDIPNDDEGGSVLIMKEETPEPTEWWETYKVYLEEKKANKNKSSYQLRQAKLQEKEEEMMRKREELIKKKIEAELMAKIMKNPTMHPGFTYPESKKTEHILEMIEQYRNDWNELDKSEALEVKKLFVVDVDKHNVYAEVKKSVMRNVDEDMRQELKVLKKALKKDYENNGEKLPEPMKKAKKRPKRKKKIKAKMSESIAEKMEDLAFKGILKKYPPTQLGDFLGDHNYAGDDHRFNLERALQFCGETRSIWWERCREVTHGYHKVLLVGPRLNGKTLLVHILATVTDAVLFELDLSNIRSLSLTSAELGRLMSSIITCTRVAQPSIIYIKHIQRLFYKKVPQEDSNMKLEVIKRLLTKKLLKRINKSDKITVVASCVDPWLAKCGPLLKLFPVAVLVPDTSYSAVFRLLQRWMNDNQSVPRDLDIHSLAYVLRGYSYGQLKEGLESFLNPDRIVKIAVHGLFPMEVYNFFLADETKVKVDYEKYLKWYSENTQWGKKETKHIEEQRKFRLAAAMYAQRAEKKKKEAANVRTKEESLMSEETDESDDEE